MHLHYRCHVPLHQCHEKLFQPILLQVEKDDLEKLKKELGEIEKSRSDMLEKYGFGNKLVKQLVDLALLANNMLKGEDLSTFVKRSVDLL